MISYFDNASTTYRKPKSVYKAVKLYKKVGGNISRGNNQASKFFIDETRKNIKKLVGANDNYEVVFSQSATFSFNQLIKGLDFSKLKNVYITMFEHNAVNRVLSNLQEIYKFNIKYLCLKGFNLSIDLVKEQLKKDKPDLVIINHVSNVCGLIQDYKPVFEEAKNYGAITILDMAQSCGLLKINMSEEKIDAIVFAGHKTLYGYVGIGGMVIDKKLKIKDIIQGGTGIDSASMLMPKTLPTRLEPGTQNLLGIYSLYYSTSYILKKEINKIFQIEQKKFRKLKRILIDSKLFNVFEIPNATSIISCLPTKYKPINFEKFFDKYGIVVRIGLQCSPYAHKVLGSYPEGTIRFSVGLFTKGMELRKLKKSLKCIYKEVN
ncbi:MAG TPA: aminotransferase class V-fold PLP-dependent enzyme [Candidatus Caccovivens faecavium]|nr:aminotransferase class V-fold PLP-dependent enzyme [Candidatus Caccovivens faecavium]